MYRKKTNHSLLRETAVKSAILWLSVTLFLPACIHGQQAAFSEQPIFSAGERGYTCFRIPALVVTDKGAILAFSEARKTNCRDDDDIDLVMKRSTDRGKTWSELQVLFDDGDLSVNQAAPVVDRKTGDVVLVFCKNNQRVFVTRSKDEGKSWASPKEITAAVVDPQWKYIGSGPGHGIQLASGRLLIPSWGDVSPGQATWRPPAWDKVQFSYAMYSDDHGATWHRSKPIEIDGSDECMAVETSPNKIYMNMRSRQKKNLRAYSWSNDGGVTWSKVEWDKTLPEPSCQGSLVRLSRKENSDKDRILLVHPSDANARSHLTIRISYDEAKTWTKSRVIREGPSSYSDLAITPEREILCLYEAGRYSSGDLKVMLSRFNLEWLTQGADHLPK